MLGTLCLQAEEQEIETVILTGDSDTLQLVSPWVRVFMASSVQQAKVYDVAGVKDRYGGLGPEAVADIKALQGDSSDNIPGVPGVGIKTAVNLVGKFGDIEQIIAHVDEVTPPRAQKNIRAGVDQLRESKVLTTIVRDAPVTLDLEASRFWQYDRSKVVGFLTDLEFLSVVPRIPAPPGGPAVGEQQSFDTTPDVPEVDYRIVDSPEALQALVSELDSPQGFSFDTETTGVDPMSADLVGLSFSNEPHTGWYVPVGHSEGNQVARDGVLEALRPLFESETVPKVAHNANYDMTVLKNQGVEVRGVTFDTMIAAALLGRRSIGLKQLALNELGIEMTELSDLIGTGRNQITMADVPIERAADYAAADADLTWQLHPRFEAGARRQELDPRHDGSRDAPPSGAGADAGDRCVRGCRPPHANVPDAGRRYGPHPRRDVPDRRASLQPQLRTAAQRRSLQPASTASNQETAEGVRHRRRVS